MNIAQAQTQLAPMLESMDLPINRKSLNSVEDLRWLCRNLSLRNHAHPKMAAASHILNACALSSLKGSELRRLGVVA